MIASPALAQANNGNWHTAARWARMLRDHCDTAILQQWDGEANDLLIALHARRSAASIAAHAQRCRATPRIVVLTGTDLYRDIRNDADAQRSLDLATRLVVLQPEGLNELEPSQRERCAVVVQSATPMRSACKSADALVAVMAGHLRDEKDPAVYMRAALRLCARGDLLFEHVGAALDPKFADAARETMRQCPRYRWLGGLSRARTRERMRRAHVLVHASRLEGGAQVIIESIRAGTPVIASRIPGNVGLLGADHPALFEVGDDAGLARLIERARDEPGFLRRLRARGRSRAALFGPRAELRALLNLIATTLGTKDR